MKSPSCLSASLVLAAALSLHAGEGVPDADLPQPFDPSLAQSLLESPPFTRSLNLSDSLTLTGIAYVEGKPVATLLNRATKESFIVSEEPNAQGWKLAAATRDPELRHTQVRIMVGPEMVVVRYGDDQLAPEQARRMSGPPVSSDGSAMAYSGRTSPSPSYRSSSYLGDNGRERYYALSERARDMFKESMHKMFEKHPEFTHEQRSDYAEKYYARALAEDQKQLAAASRRDSESSRSERGR